MSQRIYCNAPNLSFVTNQLVDRGFVERRVDPDDRRSRVLVLTDKGRRARDAVVRAAVEQSPLGGLGNDDLRQLLVLLSRAIPTS